MAKLISNTPTTTVGVARPTTTTMETRTSTFSGRGGNIPDGRGAFQDEIIVTDNFSITDVSVTLNDFIHTWVGDLIVRLRHVESETVVQLLRRPGQPQFSSSGFSSDLKGNYTFNNRSHHDFEKAAGANSIIPSGNYTPSQSLSSFNGLPSAGTWQLLIEDISAGDSGSLGSWSLALGQA